MYNKESLPSIKKENVSRCDSVNLWPKYFELDLESCS